MLQAILSLLGRSLGKIFKATFGWAVSALFGERPAREKTVLSVAVAAAAAWPLLVLGIPFPRLASMLLAFVPLSKKVPEGVIRAVWLLLALLVPFVLGVLMSRLSRSQMPGESGLKRLLRGFPTTVGLAAAFVLLVLTIPLRKLMAALRRRVDKQLPLSVKAEAYAGTARRIEESMNQAGFRMRRGAPPWWLSAPSAVLRKVGGGSFRREIPEQLFYLESDSLYLLLNPNGLALHGREVETTRARGLLAEALAFSDALETTDAGAQVFEKRLNDLRQAFEASPEEHSGSPLFKGRLEDMAAELLEAELPIDDWETLYRQMLQLSRAFAGARPLLEKVNAKEGATEAPIAEEPMTGTGRVNELSTGQLFGELANQVKVLAQKEVALAKAEVRSQVAEELKMAKGLAVAGACALVGVTLLLVGAALALGVNVMPAWAAALALGALVLAVGGVFGAKAWMTRVKKPLPNTRQTLEDDLRWARNRLA